MRRPTIYDFLLAMVGVAIFAAFATAEPVRVMTFNVRFGTADDGDNRWELRRELLMDVIHDFDPDVLGVQEALREQVDAIGDALPDHGCAGVGREADGSGEYSAIFYRRSRFDLAATDTFWLSDAPRTPGSHTWGNELPRVCTWVRLLDRTAGRRLVVFNTHWDHVSQPARLASGALMTQRISDAVAAGEPAIVTGDFNAEAANPAIGALTRGGALLVDTYSTRRSAERPAGTFHGFTGEGPRRIDAIYVTQDCDVEAAEIVRSHEGPRNPSDHFPVTAIISLPVVENVEK
jgi:endonuclease/exonuclease/phosphatase family metal-dependent hydrolase